MQLRTSTRAYRHRHVSSWPANGCAAAAMLLATLIICSLPCSLGSVPANLANFQDEYACDPNATLIVRPRTLDDVIEAVSLHDHIMTSGEGHSWNQPFFCVQPGAPLNTNAAEAAGGPEAATEQLLVTSAQGPAAGSSNATNTTSDSTTGSSNGSSTGRTLKAPIPLPRPSSANIVMTTIRPMNILVNEEDESVWVDAGVKTIDLLDYLAHHVTPSAPAGWTLGAFPWFVYQSIAGAIATGTHGSSMEHNSLSHQVLAFDVILANGTRQVFTNETHPFLMKALRVSLGKLGVLARVELCIVREVPVQRQLKALSPADFLGLMAEGQAAWASNGSTPRWMNETQFFWVVQKNQFMMVSFNRADDTNPTFASAALANFTADNTTVFSKKGDIVALGKLVLPADVGINFTAAEVLVSPPDQGSGSDLEPYAKAQRWLDGFLDGEVNQPVPAAAGDDADARTTGVRWNAPKPKSPSAFYGASNMAEGLMEISRLGITQVAGNTSAEPTATYIKQPQVSLAQLQTILYDQYEVSVPLAAIGSCWSKLLDVAYEGDLEGSNATVRSLDKGFRTAPLIRYIGQEDGLLSHTHDGPRMYLNIEDYLYYNRGRRSNERFKALMAVLTGDAACNAHGPVRLHWGKAGWPDPGCWHGDAMYGANWCHFGCAVQQLDPAGKFADAAGDRWTWAGVDLETCCGPDGFRVGEQGCECKVKHSRAMADCPPAPFYTYR